MLEKNSFSHYIMGFIGIFIVLQILVILSTMLFGTRLMQQQAHQTAENILKIYESNVNNALARADSDLRTILYDSTYINQMSNPIALNRYHAMRRVLEMLNQRLDASAETDAYIVARKDGDVSLVARSSRVPFASLDDMQAYVKQSFQNSAINDSGWKITKIGDENFLIHYYCYGQNLVAAFIKIQTLGNLYPTLFFESNALIITDVEGDWLMQIGGEIGLNLSYPLQNEAQIIQKQGYNVVTRQIPNVDMRISLVVSNQTGAVIQAIPLFIILTGVVALVFVIAFTLYSNREIIMPMEQLMETTRVIEQGKLDYRPVLRCKNEEFQALSASFSSMLDMIMKLRIDSYERIIKQQDTELKYLHMQIRPHFFLNALSTVHSMSYKRQNKKIRLFVDTLSKNFRYMFKAGLHMVTIQEEVEHIRNYLFCQDMLYPDCVFSYIEVAEEMQQWPIPQMLLHTFVENVYKHTVSIGNVTSLFIRATPCEREGEQMALLEIEDDGQGFPAEVIMAMNCAEEPEKDCTNHIGLINIARTLRLLYGRESLLHLSNKCSGGAVIKVWIPENDKLQKEGEAAFESIDCG